MIAIVDYGVGNLFSLRSSFGKIGEKVTVTSNEAVLRDAEKIILPGVGAFRDAARKLEESGLGQVIQEEAGAGKPLLGICLGMQLLFDRSFEYGEYKGLGLIPGEVRPISESVPSGLKIPHMGWNALNLKKTSSLFRNCREGEFVYFVHSYHAVTKGQYISATAEYGADLTAAVEKENVYGCQFHPEKSGEVGLKILKAFCEEVGT
jgi:glutamine amidotransferase